MKLIHDNKLPAINSIILVRYGNENIIGIVEVIQNDKLNVLMLDRIGRIIIDKNDSWICLSDDNLKTLRNSYDTYIGSDVSQLVTTQYNAFKAKYLT